MNVLLVVAEDRAIRESLRAALAETNLVLFETTVDDALRRLISVKPDAIILDDGPHLGRQALQRFKQSGAGVPAIVLTRRDDPETLAGLTLAGAAAYLTKPFSCEALCEAVARATGQHAAAPPEPARTPAAHGGETGRGRHQTALRWLSRTSSHIRDPLRLSQSLVDSATDIFDAVRSAVLLEAGGCVRVVASHGIAPALTESLRLDFRAGLMRWFEAKSCLFDRDTARDAPDAVKEMQVLGGRLAVPLLCAGRVRGAIVLGDKASGLDYTLDDVDLATALARCASIAFENAELYQTIAHQEGHLDAVLSHITAGIVTVLPNKTISMINQSAARMLRVRAEDVIGRSVQKLGSQFADVALRTLADGRPRLRAEIGDPAAGARLELNATPLGDEGIVVLFTQVDEEMVAAQDIAYSPFWEYLASRVAQEIKNPMVAINTFAQLLPRKYESTDFREAFGEVVQKEVQRINSVVETLFDFSRRPQLVLRRTSVNDTVSHVLSAFEQELDARAIALETAWDPEAPEADLDVTYFSKALQNVVQNSIDAMPNGGTLKITTHHSGEGYEVVVEDTGPGVPEKDADLVFLPFFSTKEQGMGLGLPVANRIMQEHRGGLTLLDRPEGGGAFKLRLPPTAQETKRS